MIKIIDKLFSSLC